ncbi:MULTISPECIES: integrase [Stenotrophomonas]|uniref:integrase n=1 Tax=Stenotrophomonas TaxID=40323 RepID=UPI0016616A7C|nr:MULTISPECIES: integrase [Stenotrophomonas]MBN5058845.1 integrase [Stenotrophomonas maltophilia]MBN5067173.1 integrase [Stenotrophomonas maltophilia]MCW8342873.1 integrase [Stenotrophomonas sp. SG1]UGB19417.1 integrase [Stenotrophomonas maltophilia]UGB50338.1 integrase [Stenotrophomonas maltophilia]
MTRGRKRKFNPEIPGHIDQGSLPRGLYWEDGRWYVIDPHPEGVGRIKTTVANGKARLSDLHAIMEGRGGGSLRGSLDHLTGIFKTSSEYLDLSAKSREGYDYCATKACGYLLRDGRMLGQQRVEHLSVPVLQRVVETLATGRPASGRLPAIPATPAAANRVASYLRRLFAWGIRHGHCATNPADGIRKVREKRDARMPDHDSFDAVLQFARKCASRQAHTAGSCPPYLPAVMVLAYAVRLRGIEVDTLTDAHLQHEGIRSNRRKGSRDNVTLWTKELRAAVKWLQGYRDERMQAHGRPIPIKPEQRRLLVSESGTPLTKSALDSAWQRMVRRAIAEGVIEKGQRFALHGLKHRGITDSEDKGAGGHVTEAMRQLYDHSVPVVKAAVKPKKSR